jgi:hypothetical protein
MPSGIDAPAASSAAWISPDSLQVRSYLYETPVYYTITLAFKGNDLNFVRSSNVNMGPAARMEIEGTKIR